MLSAIIKVMVIGLMIIAIAWGGVCAYSNFIAEPDTGMPKMPSAEDAEFGLHIENTGNLILTNDYEVHGDEADNRVFIVHGYWEARGNSYKFNPNDIILSEKVFGKITVRRRL